MNTIHVDWSQINLSLSLSPKATNNLEIVPKQLIILDWFQAADFIQKMLHFAVF